MLCRGAKRKGSVLRLWCLGTKAAVVHLRSAAHYQCNDNVTRQRSSVQTTWVAICKARLLKTTTKKNCPVTLQVYFLSPQIGFEPMTNRLTVERSTTELLRNIFLLYQSSRSAKSIFLVLQSNALGATLQSAHVGAAKLHAPTSTN